MQQVELKAEPRAESGRNKIKHLRRRGLVPGVVYGAHSQAQQIQLSVHDLELLIHQAHSENVLVQLKLEQAGKGRLALLQDVQHHPISRDILHVDFHELKEDEKFTVSVPVQALGEPIGVRVGGGVLEYVMRQLRVRCLPKDLPDHISIDVTNLEIGKSVHVGDIQPPPGVELLDDKGMSVLAVVAPTIEEEPAPGEATTEMAEPEVITAKKAEEGVEAPAEKGKAEAKPAKGEAKPAAGKGEAKPAAGKGEAKPEAKAEGKPAAKAEAKPEAKKK
jgi:large subunit ribosomal protein L25